MTAHTAQTSCVFPPLQLTADHVKVSQALRMLAHATTQAEAEAEAREEEHAATRQKLQVRAAVLNTKP